MFQGTTRNLKGMNNSKKLNPRGNWASGWARIVNMQSNSVYGSTIALT